MCCLSPTETRQIGDLLVHACKKEFYTTELVRAEDFISAPGNVDIKEGKKNENENNLDFDWM